MYGYHLQYATLPKYPTKKYKRTTISLYYKSTTKPTYHICSVIYALPHHR